MLIVCNEILAFPHCFLFPFSCVYPTIWGDPARTGMVKTHRFSNPGHCRDCQTKEVFTFQIAGKQLEHFRFFSNRSNGLQDFIPHTYTTTWERITVIKKIKVYRTGFKMNAWGYREPETNTENSFCHWLHAQTGQCLKSEADNHLVSCCFLLHKSQRSTTFLLHPRFSGMNLLVFAAWKLSVLWQQSHRHILLRKPAQSRIFCK